MSFPAYEQYKDSGVEWLGEVPVVISRTNSLTQTHCLFLEWHCLQAIREVSRYADQNGNSGTRPHTPAPLEADCLEIFETASTLIATLGHPLFVPLATQQATSDTQDIFFCKGSDAEGRGLYTQEGFVLLKGSSGRVSSVPSMQNTSEFDARQGIIDAGIMSEQAGRLVFVKDHLFSSPSTAAAVLMGRMANGWVEWKDESGRTLDEVKRQGVG